MGLGRVEVLRRACSHLQITRTENGPLMWYHLHSAQCLACSDSLLWGQRWFVIRAKVGLSLPCMSPFQLNISQESPNLQHRTALNLW